MVQIARQYRHDAFAGVRRTNPGIEARERSGGLPSRMPQPEGRSKAARSWPL